MDPAQRWKVVLGVLGMLFVTVPAVFATWWYMFSSTPPYQWFRENGLPTMNFPLLWICVPMGIGFVILGVVLRSIRKENISTPGSRQTPASESPPPPSSPSFDINNAFEIDALAVSDLQNQTELGHDLLGTPGWCLDCVISVHNLHPTQGLGDVTFRIIGLTPPMVAEPAHHPRTQDTTLRRVQFGFTDLPARNALAGDQTGHIRIFQAFKHLLFSEAIKEPPGKTTKTVLVFDGVWPNSLEKEFAPSGEYLLTVELTGSGVGRKEEHFALSFPLEVNKSVFRIHRVDPKCKQAIRCFQETAALLNSINIPSFHAFWRSGAGQLPSSESIAEACRLLVKNSHEDPFAGLEEYLPARDYYAFFDFLKHDASNAGVDPGEGIAYLEAAERWHDKQRYSKPSSDARLRMTFRKVATC